MNDIDDSHMNKKNKKQKSSMQMNERLEIHTNTHEMYKFYAT